MHLPKAKEETSPYVNLVEEAELEWRHFLLERGTLRKFFHLHLFILDTMEQNPPGVMQANFFSTRSLAGSLFQRDSRVYVIAKFTRFLCAAVLSPYDESKWKGTRIDIISGVLSTPQVVEDLAVGSWLMERMLETDKMIESGFSPRQKQAIAKNVDEKWEALKGSDFMQSVIADLQNREKIKSNTRDVERNDKCPCGSGLKFKKCHGR